MHKSHNTLARYWVWFGLLALACVFTVLHPELMGLSKSPMSGDPWTIKDPAVSWMAFMPSLREFRFELFEHGNILWSNMRALGQPMLGNGVQAAPLFPLTLLLIGLPDQLFWSVMPITRVLLIALASFVLARKVFGLPFIASFAFAILAGFNLNVFRWINHPWSNGLLAGLWYLVVLHQVSFAQSHSLKYQALVRIGLIVAVYSMVTCGFPEAAAAAALLVMVIFVALVFANAADFSSNWRSILHDIAVCHIAGFAFSAPQIFALLEYIDFTGAISLRDDFINATFRADEVRPYWLSQLTLLWESNVQHRYLNFSVGLLGLMLSIKGLAAWIICYPNLSSVIRSAGIGFLILMWIFVAKSFGWFAPLAWAFAHTPVLAQSHFPLYFSPLFYYGWAFFAAMGINSYAQNVFTKNWQRLVDIVFTISAMLLSIRLLELSVALFNNINRQNFWIMQGRGDGADFIYVFLVLSAVLIGWQLLNLSGWFRQRIARHSVLASSLVAAVILSGLIYEVAGTQRDRYANNDSASLFLPKEAKLTVERALQDLPIARHELRNNDYSGRFIELGIASIDNGISAMLPPNSRRVRKALYHTQYGGYFPLGGERVPGAGALLTNNLQILSPQPLSAPDWSTYQKSTTSAIRFLEWGREIERMYDNPWVLEGSVSLIDTAAISEIWIHLETTKHSLWIEADRLSVVAGSEPGLSKLSWAVGIPTQWLDELRYSFTVRAVDDADAVYHDSDKQQMTVHRPYPFSQTSRSAPVSDRLNSAVLTSQHQASQWQVNFDPKAMPRAFIANSCQRLPDEVAASAFLAETSNGLAGKVALLANSDNSESKVSPLANDFCDDYSAAFAGVAITRDVGSTLELSMVRGPALLYLNDTFYPGWLALDSVTKQTFNIEPANLGMRAVYLPEDRDYAIVFDYQPAWLKWAYLLLISGMLATFYILRVLLIRK